MEHGKISYATVVAGVDSSTTKFTDFERSCDLASALLSYFVEYRNEIESHDCDENDVMDVDTTSC